MSPESGSPEAAILVADAVGYSRAMSRDEGAALDAFGASRRLIDPLIREHGGRIFATAGDSVLAEFAQADGAVGCAVAIQRGVEAAIAAGALLMRFRMGVHLGPVHRVANDLLGDTVNVAARLEGLSNTGGVCISATVRDALGSLDGLALEPIGQRILKNIEAPIEVLRIRLGEPGREDFLEQRRLGVAVLPFVDPSGEVAGYLADGLADDLIAGLARFRTLAVMARGATFHYRGAAVDPRRVAADLGVGFVVRGTCVPQGPDLRIGIELVAAGTGSVLWAERFRGTVTDLLATQDTIVERVVAALAGQIAAAGQADSIRRRPANPAAFDLVLQGIFHAHQTEPAATATALGLFTEALALEPDYPLALAWQALMQLRRWGWAPTVAGDLLPMLETARRAAALDPGDAWCQLVPGQVAMYAGDLDLAAVHHKRAAALSPFDAHILALRSPLAVYLGKPEEGVLLIERAIRLDPFPPPWYATNHGLALHAAGRYAEAAAAYAGAATPQTGVLAGLAASLARAGDMAGAGQAAARLLAREPRFRDRGLPGDAALQGGG
ncbi:MAG: adenylate/guanylate cyclase domain-containing protein [Geminicoccaceae bacterium]